MSHILILDELMGDSEEVTSMLEDNKEDLRKMHQIAVKKEREVGAFFLHDQAGFTEPSEAVIGDRYSISASQISELERLYLQSGHEWATFVHTHSENHLVPSFPDMLAGLDGFAATMSSDKLTPQVGEFVLSKWVESPMTESEALVLSGFIMDRDADISQVEEVFRTLLDMRKDANEAIANDNGRVYVNTLLDAFEQMRKVATSSTGAIPLED